MAGYAKISDCEVDTMQTETYTKTYGVAEGFNKGRKRFFIMCDGKQTSLHYAKKNFALKKAHRFCQECHKDFVRDNKAIVHFVFKYAE